MAEIQTKCRIFLVQVKVSNTYDYKSARSGNSPASRGYPHSSEGKATVKNIKLSGKGMSHGQIQNLGSKNIMNRIKERINN